MIEILKIEEVCKISGGFKCRVFDKVTQGRSAVAELTMPDSFNFADYYPLINALNNDDNGKYMIKCEVSDDVVYGLDIETKEPEFGNID